MTALPGRPRRSGSVAPAAPVRGASRFLVTVLGVVITLWAPVAAALPAGAHDQLVGSDPADNAVLDASPATITLLFSEAPLDIQPQIVVTDRTGATVLSGVPTITGTTAVLPVPEPLADGTYRAAWRVVSSDGHPIEGVITITIGESRTESAPGTPDRTVGDPGEETEAVPEASVGATQDNATPPGTAEPAGGGSRLPLFVGLGAIGAVAAGAVLTLVRRNRSKDDS